MFYVLNAEMIPESALFCFEVCAMTVRICGVLALLWDGQLICISVSQFTEKDRNGIEQTETDLRK